MSGYQQTKNYIYYSHRPFTSQQIVKNTGICYETVKKYLQDLNAEGYIKQIGVNKGKKVYIYNQHKGKKKPYRVAHQKHYTLEDIQEAYRRQLKKWRDEFDDLL